MLKSDLQSQRPQYYIWNFITNTEHLLQYEEENLEINKRSFDGDRASSHLHRIYQHLELLTHADLRRFCGFFVVCVCVLDI